MNDKVEEFRSDPKLFIAACENLITAESAINDCIAFASSIKYADLSECIASLNNSGISDVASEVDTAKASLMQLDSEFCSEYLKFLQEKIAADSLDFDSMSDEDKLKYSIEYGTYEKDYNYALYGLLKNLDKSNMLSDELKNQLEIQKTIIQLYGINDKIANLEFNSPERSSLLSQMGELEKRAIDLNPDLTDEEKKNEKMNIDATLDSMLKKIKYANDKEMLYNDLKSLEEGTIDYYEKVKEINQFEMNFLNSLPKTTEIEEKIKEFENMYYQAELGKLTILKEENNGFWHPFIEDEIDAAISDIRLKLDPNNEGLKDWIDMNGWQRAWENTKTFCCSIFSGSFSVVEGIVDGAVTLAGGVGSLFGADTEWAENFVEKEYVDMWYDELLVQSGFINSVAAYSGFHTAGEFIGEAGTKIAITCASPYTAEALFGLNSMGQTAEEQLINGSNFNTAFWKSAVAGVGGAVEGYGYSVLNSGVRNFLSSGSLRTLGGAAVSNVRSAFASPGGVAHKIWDLTKAGVKNTPHHFKNGLVGALTDKDAIIETGCVIADNVIDGTVTGKMDWNKTLTEAALVFGTNTVMGTITDMAMDVGPKSVDDRVIRKSDVVTGTVELIDAAGEIDTASPTTVVSDINPNVGNVAIDVASNVEAKPNIVDDIGSAKVADAAPNVKAKPIIVDDIGSAKVADAAPNVKAKPIIVDDIGSAKVADAAPKVEAKPNIVDDIGSAKVADAASNGEAKPINGDDIGSAKVADAAPNVKKDRLPEWTNKESIERAKTAVNNYEGYVKRKSERIENNELWADVLTSEYKYEYGSEVIKNIQQYSDNRLYQQVNNGVYDSFKAKSLEDILEIDGYEIDKTTGKMKVKYSEYKKTKDDKRILVRKVEDAELEAKAVEKIFDNAYETAGYDTATILLHVEENIPNEGNREFAYNALTHYVSAEEVIRNMNPESIAKYENYWKNTLSIDDTSNVYNYGFFTTTDNISTHTNLVARSIDEKNPEYSIEQKPKNEIDKNKDNNIGYKNGTEQKTQWGLSLSSLKENLSNMTFNGNKVTKELIEGMETPEIQNLVEKLIAVNKGTYAGKKLVFIAGNRDINIRNITSNSLPGANDLFAPYGRTTGNLIEADVGGVDPTNSGITAKSIEGIKTMFIKLLG